MERRHSEDTGTGALLGDARSRNPVPVPTCDGNGVTRQVWWLFQAAKSFRKQLQRKERKRDPNGGSRRGIRNSLGFKGGV